MAPAFAHVPDTVAIAVIGAAVLLFLGGVITLMKLVKKWGTRGAPHAITSDDLQQLLRAALPPTFAEYLARSNPGQAQPDGSPDEPLNLTRLRHILLTPPTQGAPLIDAHAMALGLAVLEVRINTLAQSVERVERSAIGEDRLARTIIMVLGAVIGMLAGIVAIVAGVASLA